MACHPEQPFTPAQRAEIAEIVGRVLVSIDQQRAHVSRVDLETQIEWAVQAEKRRGSVREA